MLNKEKYWAWKALLNEQKKLVLVDKDGAFKFALFLVRRSLVLVGPAKCNIVKSSLVNGIVAALTENDWDDVESHFSTIAFEAKLEQIVRDREKELD